MNRIVRLLLLLSWLEIPALPQAVPSPEQLLPADALGVVTVPDLAAARKLFDEQPLVRLWHDPAMAPFVNKFLAKLDRDWRQPLEHELGFNLTNLFNVARGQVTFALTRSGWPLQADAPAGLLLLLDARDQADQLRKLLAGARASLKSRGRKLEVEDIGGVEFMIMEVASYRPQPGDSIKDAGGGIDSDAPAPRKFFIGQTGSLLIAGSIRSDVEQVLKLKAGGVAPTLATAAAFQADFTASFRAATAYGWLHLEPMLDAVTESIGAAGTELPMGLDAGVILETIGLKGLRSVAFAATLKEGTTATEFHVRLPEVDRKGLFRLFAFKLKSIE